MGHVMVVVVPQDADKTEDHDPLEQGAMEDAVGYVFETQRTVFLLLLLRAVTVKVT